MTIEHLQSLRYLITLNGVYLQLNRKSSEKSFSIIPNSFIHLYLLYSQLILKKRYVGQPKNNKASNFIESMIEMQGAKSNRFYWEKIFSSCKRKNIFHYLLFCYLHVKLVRSAKRLLLHMHKSIAPWTIASNGNVKCAKPTACDCKYENVFEVVCKI